MFINLALGKGKKFPQIIPIGLHNIFHFAKLTYICVWMVLITALINNSSLIPN